MKDPINVAKGQMLKVLRVELQQHDPWYWSVDVIKVRGRGIAYAHLEAGMRTFTSGNLYNLQRAFHADLGPYLDGDQELDAAVAACLAGRPMNPVMSP